MIITLPDYELSLEGIRGSIGTFDLIEIELDPYAPRLDARAVNAILVSSGWIDHKPDNTEMVCECVDVAAREDILSRAITKSVKDFLATTTGKELIAETFHDFRRGEKEAASISAHWNDRKEAAPA